MKNDNEFALAFSNELLQGITQIIEHARQKTALFLNTEKTVMYWTIGTYINQNIKDHKRAEYGTRILATLSQQLSWSHFNEPAIKVAQYLTKLPNKQWFFDKLHKALELAKMNDNPNKDLII